MDAVRRFVPVRLRRPLLWVAAVVAASLLLALRSAISHVVMRRIDPRLVLTEPEQILVWQLLYHGAWALLTPVVFATVRRVRITRSRWAVPFLFHAAAAVIVSTVMPIALSVVFGVAMLGRGWPDLGDFLTPFWTWYAAVRVVNDTLLYGIVVAAGHAVCVFDEYHEQRLKAAELERSLVAAQVESLRMKLQPHFLFNTLNSISFLAIEQDTAAVELMVQRLGTLLRASMSSSGQHTVPLETELALLDQYLSIEEVRFRDRLRITRRVDPDAVGAFVPSLVLQPIVENSIKHGYSKRLDASRLDVHAYRDGDQLVVDVTDDGPGLPPDWQLATHCGRGLRNVVERLDALYHGQWSFDLRSAGHHGTTATLRVPLHGPAHH